MNCPVCAHPMIILELNRIEIDHCTNCYGTWLDEGELELLLQDSEIKDNFLESFSIVKVSSEKSVKCPICNKKMDKVLCGEKNQVTLDKCTLQHGIWFNKGELQNIVGMGSLDKQNKIITLLNEMFSYNLNKPMRLK